MDIFRTDGDKVKKSKTQLELERIEKKIHPGKDKKELKLVLHNRNYENKDIQIDEDKIYYGVAIASLILSVLFWPLGLIMGIFCFKKMKRGTKGRGFAIAAMFIGVLTIIFYGVAIAALLFLGSSGLY